MTKKRPTATELLATKGEKKGTSWINLLNKTDKEFVWDVVQVLKSRPDVSLLSAARALIAELDIDRNTETVCRTLRELIHNAK